MHLLILIVASLLSALFAAGATAHPLRSQFTVPTSRGDLLVEGFGSCANATCPAVIILSGSKGFGAAAYDEIGQVFQAAGLNAYLVHVLTAADLDAIATAKGARTRIAYHSQRLPDWISATQTVASYLKAQPSHAGKVGILGISLGAQIASAVSAEQTGIDALVLVDGGFPSGYSHPSRSLPPLLLIWGSADQTFPLSVGQKLQQQAKGLGGTAFLDVYEGGTHDFFLRSETRNADVAQQSATAFLASHLSR